jgi:carbon-monoxide dehydrogenase small subunit
MKRSISVKVNGATHAREVEPAVLLVDFLREALRLTGTHVGCDTSQCGACTILLNGRATKSCTLLAVQADGAEITTIEGLSKNGEFHPIQRAFQKEHALQCGFCTPGMIITAVDLLARSPEPSDREIRHALEGNLCRCTGYQNIVNAISTAATEMRGAGAERRAPAEAAPAEVKT